jgi:hypothetical protein
LPFSSNEVTVEEDKTITRPKAERNTVLQIIK